MTDTPSAPAPPGTRLIALDATRGLAVMGILLMNIIAFAMPESAYVHPLAWGGDGPLDLGVWAVNQLLFEGRMRGLFALLFGASALLVMASAERSGRNPVATHLARMFVLALLGSAHLLLVWDGDVLLHYALIALVIWPLRGLRPRALAGLAVVVLALHTLFWSAIFIEQLHTVQAAAQPGASAALIERARTIVTETPGPGDPSILGDLRLYGGSWAAIVAHKWAEYPGLSFMFLEILGGETLGYMLIGMALYRSGFFTGGWSDAAVRRLAVVSYAIGLPALAALTAWQVGSGYDRVVVMGHFLGWSIPFRVLTAVGHIALATLLVRRFAGSRAVARIAAVGRMALTNYLATSIVMTTIFYGYGLGLYGKVDRAPVYLFVFAMWAAMLLWSRPWLARHRFGPAEWLWRSLARLQPQPMRGPAAD